MPAGIEIPFQTVSFPCQAVNKAGAHRDNQAIRYKLLDAIDCAHITVSDLPAFSNSFFRIPDKIPRLACQLQGVFQSLPCILREVVRSSHGVPCIFRYLLLKVFLAEFALIC